MSDHKSRTELSLALVAATRDPETKEPRAVRVQISNDYLPCKFTGVGAGGFLVVQALDANGAPMQEAHLNPDCIQGWMFREGDT